MVIVPLIFIIPELIRNLKHKQISSNIIDTLCMQAVPAFF